MNKFDMTTLGYSVRDEVVEKSLVDDLLKGSPDQPRDEQGRFSAGQGKAKELSEKAHAASAKANSSGAAKDHNAAAEAHRLARNAHGALAAATTNRAVEAHHFKLYDEHKAAQHEHTRKADPTGNYTLR